MAKTIDEINEKIKRGKHVVTTGAFGPICSSGAYLNVGHSKPRIKLGGGSSEVIRNAIVTRGLGLPTQ